MNLPAAKTAGYQKYPIAILLSSFPDLFGESSVFLSGFPLTDCGNDNNCGNPTAETVGYLKDIKKPLSNRGFFIIPNLSVARS